MIMKQHFLKIWAQIKKHKNIFKENNLVIGKIIRYILAGIVGIFILMMLFVLFIVFPSLPNIDNIQNLVAAQSSLILDRDGNVLYTIHGDENRKIVSIDKISPYAAQAILAIEDDTFYDHLGIDIGAIFKAVCYEVHICSQPRGGSTITQQYVKNAFLSSERTYSRKLKEIILALKLENKYSKDEILEMYLNRIPYGSNIFGVEVASQKFFGKPAVELTLAESAILASIPKAPTYYYPYGTNIYARIDLNEEEILRLNIKSEQDLIKHNPNFVSKGLLGKTYTFGVVKEGDEIISEENRVDIYIKGRVDFVLTRMFELGHITEEEMEEAIKEANATEFVPFRENIKAPHFVMYVRELLEAKYGKDTIEKGGLRITTTINGMMQDAADNAVESRAEHNEKNFLATNASLVAIDPDSGEILAMVGSRDFWNDEIDGKVNVALRPRLPGSSFKPIAYAAAFLQGYAPSTVVYDVRTKFGGWYEPENFDGQFRGPVSFKNALAASLNIPAVKATFLAGVPNVLDLARKMGLDLNQPDDWYGISLGLGAGEVKLIDHVAAYGVFANGGYRVTPVSILKVEDRNGNILEEYEAPKKRDLILDPQVAYLINSILSDAGARPDEYWRSMLTVPGHTNGAKTGTSNKKINNVNYPFDTWTLGYTRNLTAGVWAGNANGDHLASRASGLDLAAPIWKAFMTEATKDMPKEQFEKPEGIKYIKVSKKSGKLPSEYTPEEDVATGIFASFSAPQGYDDGYRLVEIDKISGKLATEYTPLEAVEEKAYYSHHSILPDDPNWENAVRKWAEANNQDESPPEEFDDVHTAQTMNVKPEIQITSPKSNSEVSPPFIGIWVDINSPAGISKVDYYWDGELVNTADSPPYKGNVQISSSIQMGSTHIIKAIVFDELYRSNQSSVNVKIGEDTLPPIISFTYPADGTKLTAGESMVAQVDAKDPNGDILKVEFYLNEELKETVKIPPFVWQFTVPAVGTYELKAIAYDHAKNKAVDNITIHSGESGVSLSGDSRILEPASKASFDEGATVLIQAYVSSEHRNNLKELSIFSKKVDSNSSFTITTAKGDAQTYTFIWSSPSAGRYEIYLKIELNDGKIYFSKRVPITIR